MRVRAKIGFLAVGATSLAVFLLWACGIDVTGASLDREAAPPDNSVPEAHLPPELDSGDDAADLDARTDADASAGCASTGRGPEMLLVTGPDGGRFCIDVTEVTNAQYDAFLAATGGGRVDAGVPKAWPDAGPCALMTTTFVRTPNNFDAGGPGFPAVNMSWCDAYAFCDWAGKRMCRSGSRDASAGEWYEACSAFGTRKYAYGNAYVATVCNDTNTHSVAVGSASLCEGGVAGGLFDMNGNVDEYIDNCNAARDSCYAVGGNWTDLANATCSFATSSGPTASLYGIGFRCCADP